MLLRTGDAHEPFCIGKLGPEILRLAQLEINGRRSLRRDFRRCIAIEIVSCGPDSEGIGPRVQFCRGELIASFLITDNGKGYCRADFLGADEDAPSMAPSSVEVTRPVNAKPGEFAAPVKSNATKKEHASAAVMTNTERDFLSIRTSPGAGYLNSGSERDGVGLGLS